MREGLPGSEAREGQALALRYEGRPFPFGDSRGTGPRATVGGKAVRDQAIANYRGPGPRATV